MSDYEIISIVIAIVCLTITVMMLALKLFAILDNRYKRK